METPYLAELLMRGFRSTFDEFKQYLQVQFMSLVDDLRALKDSDALVQAALAEQAQVLTAIQAYIDTKATNDARIAELLAQLAAQQVTLDEAQTLVNEIKDKQAADLAAIASIYTPPSTETPVDETPVEETPTEETVEGF